MPNVAGRNTYAALHGHEHHHHSQQYVPLPPRRWSIVMALIVFGAFLLLEPRHRIDPGGTVPGRVQQDMVRKAGAAVVADSDQVMIPAPPVPAPVKVAGPAAVTTAVVITTLTAPAAPSPTDAPTVPPAVHPIPPQPDASAPEFDPTTAARLITQLAPRPEAYDGTSPRLTDPRWDGYVVAIHSGVGTAAERVPVQLSTFLQGVRHIVLLGDTNDVEIAGIQMVDVVRGGQYIRDAEDRMRHKEAANNLGKRSVPNPEHDDPAPAANATSKHLAKRDDARLREHVPNQNSDGWRGDAHKFIPGALAMYDRYPNAKWYLILDDDTYMFMENLHVILDQLDGDQVYYFGKYYPSGGCPGGTVWPDGPVFAHGGGGIVMSRAALTQMLGVADSCIVKYRDCFAGDIRLAQCMRDAGIQFHATVAPDLFHNVAPHVANFGGYEQGTACRRVVSFHHLTPHAMMRLYAADRDAHRAAIDRVKAGQGPADVPKHWVPRTAEGKARQGALQAHAPHIDSLPSTFYAPVTQADVFRRIVEADMGEFDYQVRRHAPAGKKITPCRMPSEGRAACEADPTCASWDYSPLDQACYLSEGVRKAEPALGFSSGVIKGRYRCDAAVW